MMCRMGRAMANARPDPGPRTKSAPKAASAVTTEISRNRRGMSCGRSSGRRSAWLWRVRRGADPRLVGIADRVEASLRRALLADALVLGVPAFLLLRGLHLGRVPGFPIASVSVLAHGPPRA